MTRVLLLFFAVTSSCGNGDVGPRHVSSDDGVSFAELDGWSIGRERATLVLTRPRSSAVIAVRTVPRDSWSEPRDEENVVPAVAKVLAALPGARVSGPKELDGAGYPGVTFDVEFTPPGGGGTRYQRRHAVLFGSRRILHVFLTAPAGQIAQGKGAFDTIVETIEEEG